VGNDENVPPVPPLPQDLIRKARHRCCTCVAAIWKELTRLICLMMLLFWKRQVLPSRSKRVVSDGFSGPMIYSNEKHRISWIDCNLFFLCMFDGANSPCFNSDEITNSCPYYDSQPLACTQKLSRCIVCTSRTNQIQLLFFHLEASMYSSNSNKLSKEEEMIKVTRSDLRWSFRFFRSRIFSSKSNSSAATFRI